MAVFTARLRRDQPDDRSSSPCHALSRMNLLHRSARAVQSIERERVPPSISLTQGYHDSLVLVWQGRKTRFETAGSPVGEPGLNPISTTPRKKAIRSISGDRVPMSRRQWEEILSTRQSGYCNESWAIARISEVSCHGALCPESSRRLRVSSQPVAVFCVLIKETYPQTEG